METDTDSVILIWGHGEHQHTIPHSRDTNTPVFPTAPTTSTYCVFSAHIEAMEANFHRQQHIVQFPGRCRLMHNEAEFLAKENLLLSDKYYKKTNTLVTEGASHNDETTKLAMFTQARQIRTNWSRRPHKNWSSHLRSHSLAGG